jgi:hypothetical protein
MPEIMYRVKRFREAKIRTMALIREVVSGYQEQGFDLTLRQLYYHFVSHDLFPEDRKWTWNGRRWVKDPEGTVNADPNYNWLGGVVNDARLAGVLDWDTIVDRLRDKAGQQHWDSPVDIVETAVRSYHIDKWAPQHHRLEVWVEKEAMVQVVERAAYPLDVDYFSCKGYVSQSAMWRAAQRLKAYEDAGQDVVVLYLGDHDPSGIDMTRDIQERLWLFQADVGVKRIALTMDQIDEQKPPPNPTKLTDSRASAYINEYGFDCWEMDALEPAFIVDLITDEVFALRDHKLWDEAVSQEEEEKGLLNEAAKDIKSKLEG